MSPPVTWEIGPAVRSAGPLRPPPARLLRGLVPPHVLTRRALPAQDDDTGAPERDGLLQGKVRACGRAWRKVTASWLLGVRGALHPARPPASSSEPWFSTRGDLAPSARVAMSGDVFGWRSWGGCLAGGQARSSTTPVPRAIRQANANSARLTNPAFNARPRSSGVNYCYF